MVETSIPILVPNSVTMYQLSTFFLCICAPLVHCDEIGDIDGNVCPHLSEMHFWAPKIHCNFNFGNKIMRIFLSPYFLSFYMYWVKFPPPHIPHHLLQNRFNDPLHVLLP